MTVYQIHVSYSPHAISMTHIHPLNKTHVVTEWLSVPFQEI